MSKNKKNKKKFKGARKLYYTSSPKKNKKNGKKNKNKKQDIVTYASPVKKFKTHDSSLNKKQLKTVNKLLKKKAKIPAELEAVQTACNHAGPVMSVSQWKEANRNASAYSPNMDYYVSLFGEENVCICRDCLKALVKPNAVTLREVKRATAVLQAATMAVLPRIKLKKDEAEKYNTKSDKLGTNFFADVVEKFEAMSQAGVFNNGDNRTDDAAVSAEALSKLSSATSDGTAYVM